jgi:hypothetical protein
MQGCFSEALGQPICRKGAAMPLLPWHGTRPHLGVQVEQDPAGGADQQQRGGVGSQHIPWLHHGEQQVVRHQRVLGGLQGSGAMQAV